MDAVPTSRAGCWGPTGAHLVRGPAVTWFALNAGDALVWVRFIIVDRCDARSDSSSSSDDITTTSSTLCPPSPTSISMNVGAPYTTSDSGVDPIPGVRVDCPPEAGVVELPVCCDEGVRLKEVLEALIVKR